MNKPNPAKDALRTERMESIRAFWTEGKPPKFFKDYALQDLLDAGIPREDLAKAGIAKGETGDNPELKSEVSLRDCASLMSDHYGEYVSVTAISRAVNDKGAPRRKNGRIVPAELIPWWDVHERNGAADAGEHGNLFSQAQQAELQRKIDMAKRERLELEAVEKANSDKWMLVEYHNASMQRAGGIAWGRFSAIVEKELPEAHEAKLRQLEVPPELLTEIMTHIRSTHLAAVDNLQKEMEKMV